MARKKRTEGTSGNEVLDLRHKGVTRLNIPPAGLTARGEILRERKLKYAYNPHLSPGLRFDGTGRADKISGLIEDAGRRKLEPEELKILQEALGNHEPWLEWAGKREQQWCVADPVALHIHERLSTQAILKAAKRENPQRDLFLDPEQEYREAVQFYKWPMDWTNRFILGDSLAVMASLSRREALAGKVQMIYMDPPYGIKYASNFQPEVGRRDVKDRDEDLTREPEMVKAYRDTWTLGVHSYLSYLRDRLLLCKELLADTGSVFVQISDENLHRVRAVMDEVFKPHNVVAIILMRKSGWAATNLLPRVHDFILWFAKDIAKVKFHQLYVPKTTLGGETSQFTLAEDPETGLIRTLSPNEAGNPSSVSELRVLGHENLTSEGPSANSSGPILFQGKQFWPGVGGRTDRHWKTTSEGMQRLIAANRLMSVGQTLRQKKYIESFSVSPLGDHWEDTAVSGFAEQKVYVVQTNPKAITRCLLMTTDPGDLVLDPTGGSGTSAYVSEQWGRRWISIDASRVAIAIARQRLLTAKFDYYKLRPTSAEDVDRNPDGSWLSDPEGRIQGTSTFECKTVPHITLKSIAQNQALDPIFEKWEPVLAEKLTLLNKALSKTVTTKIRKALLLKLQEKTQREGRRAVTNADERRWKLPETEWKEWEVPFDSDPDWPAALQTALIEYRTAWRQKMDEVNACIAARADHEELVDQPYKDNKKLRVAGPFTVEGVIPAEESIDLEPEESPIVGAPDNMETFNGEDIASEAQNAEAYIDRMIRLLREDGVRFPDNRVMKFSSLEALAEGSVLHAKGSWGEEKEERLVAVMFGPQYGSLNTVMVEEGIRAASRRGFDDIVFAAFSFDGTAQATIQEVKDPHVRLHMAQIRPDVVMGDLLKTTVSSQLFTVSGTPRTKVRHAPDGQYVVEMEGVDIYDPVSNTVRSSGAAKVAAWFLDTDYDGRCFCVTQAFFPDKSAWDKLSRALNNALDPEAFAKLSGTISIPFPAGDHKRIAVKVIDPRGNEVMRVHSLEGYHV